MYIDLKTAGDSTLVKFPNGKTMLIDGGYKKSYPHVKPILDFHGVEVIDIMVATHPDADHINGLKELLKVGDFQVKKVCPRPEGE